MTVEKQYRIFLIENDLKDEHENKKTFYNIWLKCMSQMQKISMMNISNQKRVNILNGMNKELKEYNEKI